jgi:DNA-binding transcriptional ArsR family regulator
MDDSVTRFEDGFDPALDVMPDLASLAVLTHPLRLKLLGELRRYGPATASGLGVRLGESSGATSYHLRALAKAGFVIDDPGRGTTRERWWKAAHRSTYVDFKEGDDVTLGAEYTRAIARHYAENMLRFSDSVETVAEDYGDGWEHGYTLSDHLVEVTPAEAKALIAEIGQTILRYRRETAPEGARQVSVQYQIFPTRRTT